MIRRGILTLFNLICCIFLIIPAHGQNAAYDSSLYFSRLKAAVYAYHQFTGSSSRLYNGIQYVSYQFQSVGNPFFLSDDSLSEGSVCYDGIVYDQIPLLYDIKRDQLVLQSFDGNTLIVLVRHRVSWFKLLGHTFIPVSADSASNLDVGYYDLLYNGPHEVLERWTKSLQTSYSGLTADREFQQSVSYYIRNGNRFEELGTRKAALRMFHDKKAAIKTYLRKNKIKFHRDPATTLARMAAYYDQNTP